MGSFADSVPTASGYYGRYCPVKSGQYATKPLVQFCYVPYLALPTDVQRGLGCLLFVLGGTGPVTPD